MQDIDTLARTLWGEARGEGDQGMKAVANVIMNRTALAHQHPHFGSGSVASACLAPWQFSCHNAGDPNLAKLKTITDADPIFAKCVQIARDAVNGSLDDNTAGATYYYASGTREPAWASGKTPCAVIGHHLFFSHIA